MARQLPTHADLVKAGWAAEDGGDAPVTVTHVFAGHASTTRATKLQHAYAAEMVRQRQAAGYFTPCEAAQELENFSLVPNAVEFLNQRLLPAIRSGELRAFSESDRFPLVGREVNPMGDYVTQAGVNDWFQTMGLPIRWNPITVDAKPASITPSEANLKPVSRSAAQEAAILQAIRNAGADPQKLPPAPKGKAGIKAQIREDLKDNRLFAGSTVFDKAWDRMLAQKDLVAEKREHK